MADQPDYARIPAPIKAGPGAVSSHDLAVADLQAWGRPDLSGHAERALIERKAYGLAKYETILHKDDGRPRDQDAEDEVLDLVVYLRTWMDGQPELRGILWPIYRDALWAAAAITSLRAGVVLDFWGKCQGPLTELESIAPTTPEDR